jgi:hypothetical protein
MGSGFLDGLMRDLLISLLAVVFAVGLLSAGGMYLYMRSSIDTPEVAASKLAKERARVMEECIKARMVCK